MDRKQVKEILPILTAFADGKAIQSRCIKGDTSLWYDDEDPSFDGDFEYRIKPVSKYRPFKDAEECWQEMLKHQPFGWLKDKSGNKLIIENVDSRGCVEVYNGGACSFNEVFEYFTFADRLPFGVKVEELLWHG
jgi:hypothetical protein